MNLRPSGYDLPGFLVLTSHVFEYLTVVLCTIKAMFFRYRLGSFHIFSSCCAPNVRQKIVVIHWASMAIELATQYLQYVDELFYTESKKSIQTNQDFDWTGAHTVKVYKVGTAAMNDYGRNGPAEGNWSRYGTVADLDATTEEFTLAKDRSFTFAIDTLDNDETKGNLVAASALARQLREVVVPEVDTWTYGKMIAGAGTKPTALALTSANIYDEIIKGTNVLGNAEAPDAGHILVVTPDTWATSLASYDCRQRRSIHPWHLSRSTKAKPAIVSGRVLFPFLPKILLWPVIRPTCSGHRFIWLTQRDNQNLIYYGKGRKNVFVYFLQTKAAKL